MYLFMYEIKIVYAIMYLKYFSRFQYKRFKSKKIYHMNLLSVYKYIFIGLNSPHYAVADKMTSKNIDTKQRTFTKIPHPLPTGIHSGNKISIFTFYQWNIPAKTTLWGSAFILNQSYCIVSCERLSKAVIAVRAPGPSQLWAPCLRKCKIIDFTKYDKIDFNNHAYSYMWGLAFYSFVENTCITVSFLWVLKTTWTCHFLFKCSSGCHGPDRMVVNITVVSNHFHSVKSFFIFVRQIMWCRWNSWHWTSGVNVHNKNSNRYVLF